MQHPKVRQRDADLGFVTVILIVPIGRREADSGGVLASKTLLGLSLIGMGLDREHLANIQHFEEIRQPAAETRAGGAVPGAPPALPR